MNYDRLYNIAFGERVTEKQAEEWWSILNKHNSFDPFAGLGDIIGGRCTSAEFDHFCKVHLLLEKCATYPLELPKYIEPEPLSFDKEVSDILDQPVRIEDKANQICELLEKVQREYTGLPTIETALDFVIEHLDPFKCRRLTMITGYMYNYYAAHRHTDVNEELAQKILDMYPPSVTKAYECNNKVTWALQVVANHLV